MLWTPWIVALIVLLVAFLLYVNSKPDRGTFARSTLINAPAAKVFPLINDMAASLTWNPFVKKDPNLKGTLSGPGAGPGAKYAFVGNKDVGSGNVEITHSQADAFVRMRLQMIAPFKVDNRVEFTLVPEGNGTRVTWAMEGEAPFMAKLMSTVLNMDKMMAREFDAGLAELKAMAERDALPGR
ncbi:MAG: SRPBCC family protein [Burkholderiales bacterium]|nr:SRPBCC family protein [Burkholderiales bacterium]